VTEHLSTQLAERYRQRQLDPFELLMLDDHLSGCASCRRQLRDALALSTAAQRLQTNALTVRDEEIEHPSESQLRSHLMEQLDAVDRELVESHLEFCADCQSRRGELRLAMRQTGNAAPEKWFSRAIPDWLKGGSVASGNRLSLSFALRFAVAASLMVLLVWSLMRWRPNSDKRQNLAGASPSPSSDIGHPSPQFTLAPLLALNDDGRQVTLDADGNLTGIESLSAVERQSIKNALTTGQVETPNTLAELKSAANGLMGERDANPDKAWAASSNSTLLAPFAEVVAEDRPTMIWKALEGAKSYVVTINDPAANYREIAVSHKLTATRWTPPRALPRGRLYTWQVTAFINDREITAPGPESREAKFRVLTQSQADELAQVRRIYAGRHLALGLSYARLGLLKDAERELQALAADNPQAPIAQKLLRDLRGKRQNVRIVR